MYCTYCGANIDKDSVFCSFCGKPADNDNDEAKDNSASNTKNDLAQERLESNYSDKKQATINDIRETATSSKILLTTIAIFGIKKGTLNLYNDKLECVCVHETLTVPINEIQKVCKSYGFLEITTIDKNVYSFGFNGDLVNQWVEIITQMISKENVNIEVTKSEIIIASNNAEPLNQLPNNNQTEPEIKLNTVAIKNEESTALDNTDAISQLPDIKQTESDEEKTVIDECTNNKEQPIRKNVLHKAIVIIIVLVIVKIITGGGHVSKKEIINVAKYEVSNQIIGKYEPNLVDAKIVAKDGHQRYIVTMTQKGTFENYWVCLIEFDESGEYYRDYCDYHGSYNSIYGSLSKDGLIELYKTNSNFHWGEKTWVYND